MLCIIKVNDPIQHITENKLREAVGPEFNFKKKLKMGGTGSMKVIHIEGIDFIDKFEPTSKSQHYVSFELRPNALIGRTNGNIVKTFFLRAEDVVGISFETHNLRIMTRNGIVIRHEAIIQIEIDKRIIKLYVPRSAYSPVKNFLKKDWLHEKVDYSVSNSEPEVNYNSVIADVITRILG